MTDSITEIINPNFRSGTTKNGKPYTIMLVKTETGKQASIFAPAAIGDEIELSYNSQFQNYSARKVTAQSKEQSALAEKIDKILAIVTELQQAQSVAQVQDIMPGAEEVEQEIDIDDIPFG